MPNWSIKATAAAINSANPTNIDVTFTATNSVTAEVVSEVAPSSNWTVSKATAYAETMRDRLVLRDSQRATSSAALPGIHSFIAGNTVLATG